MYIAGIVDEEGSFNKVNVCGLLGKTIILQPDENHFVSIVPPGPVYFEFLQSASIATGIPGLPRF
jgi:hypothetical protein